MNNTDWEERYHMLGAAYKEMISAIDMVECNTVWTEVQCIEYLVKDRQRLRDENKQLKDCVQVIANTKVRYNHKAILIVNIAKRCINKLRKTEQKRIDNAQPS